MALDLVNHGANWWLAMVLAALITGAIGLLVHQALLRWNQGQDLRQALITIAVATILADQMIVHFGSTPSTLTAPGELSASLGTGHLPASVSGSSACSSSAPRSSSDWCCGW